MALLIETTVDTRASVTDAVIAAYSARRERVQTMALGDLVEGAVAADLSGVSALVAADMRVAEVIADHGVDLERLPSAAWALASRGWDMIVLVPCDRIGDAHTSLRSAPCSLQPWWFDADGVWFGALETP